MRLDKFLKISRIIKRRSVARDFADAERITINGRPAKAASQVVVGDTITIHSGSHWHSYQVLEIRENVRADEDEMMYRVVD